MKHTPPYILILLFTCFGLTLKSQIVGNNRFNQWYFGDQWTLDFNYNPPLHTKSSAMSSFEGSASIADQNGKLLFYTNGEKIWNRNNQVMPNGDGLLGDEAAAMPAIIVPVIGNRNKFYVFTTDGSTTDPANGPKGRFDGLHYSIVDMELANGLGDVVPGKKNTLLVDSTTERIIAMDGANDREYWVITQLHASRVYYAYKIDCNGIDTNPVISNVGLPLLQLFFGIESYGYMKPNHSGTMVASVVSDPAFSGLVQRIQLMDFDRNTGTFSNPRLISGTANAYYGIEFSPNDSVLYVSDFAGKKILNYQVYASNVQATEQVVHSYSGFSFDVGALQLAPNGSIYIRRTGKLDRLTDPDNYANPGFVQDAVNLISPPLLIASGLPVFFDIWPPEMTLPDTTICWGDSIRIGVNTLPGFSYSWHPGQSLDDSASPNPLAFPRSTTEYTVIASNGACSDTAKFTINVLGDSLFIQSSTGTFDWCPATGMTLSVSTGDCLQWIVNGNADPADSLNTITVSTTGLYRAAVMNPCGRIDTVEILVYVTPPMAITNPTDSVRICRGGSTLLIGGGGDIVRWRYNGMTIPGEKKSFLFAEKAGIYEVVVTDTCNLLDSSAIVVLYHPDAQADLNMPDTLLLCPGNDTVLNVTGDSVVNWYFNGNALNVNDRFLIVNQAGFYEVVVQSKVGCQDTASIYLDFYSSQSKLILEGDTSVCEGEILLLHAKSGGSYQWRPSGIVDCDTCAEVRLSVTADTSIILQYTAQGGCSFYDTADIIVKSLPNLIISPDTGICPGDSILLSAQGAAHYEWREGTTIICSDCPQITVSPKSDQTYIVEAEGANKCRKVDSVKVQVYPKPSLTLTGPDTACYNESVVFHAGGADHYQWMAANLACDTCPATTITAQNSDTLVLIGSNNYGCADTISKSLFVYAPGSVRIEGDSVICAGDSGLFKIKSPGLLTNIQWHPATFVDCPNCEEVSFFPPSDTLLKVNATTSNGCNVSDSLPIKLRDRPVVFAGNDTMVCENDTITFSASAGLNYRWFSTNPLSCDSCQTTDLIVKRTDELLLAGMDAFHCTGYDTVRITSIPAPDLQITGDSIFCPGDTATLFAMGAASYQWEGSFSFSCDTCAMTSFQVSNSSAVMVEGMDANHCASRDTVQIQIRPATSVQITVDSIICEGSSGVLNISGVSEVEWWGNGDFSCDTCFVTTISGTQDFIVYSHYTANNTCRYLDSMMIRIMPKPKITITPAQAEICRYDTITLKANSDIPAFFQWSGLPLDCDTCSEIQVAPLNTSTLSVVASSFFQCTDTQSVEIEVRPLPSQFLPDLDSVCPGEPLTLSGVGDYEFHWSGPGLSCTACDSPEIVVNEPLTLFVTAIDSFGCQGFDSLKLSPYAKDPVLAGPDTIICQNDSIFLRAGDFVTYYWWPEEVISDPFASSPLAFPNDSITIYVEVLDVHHCHSYDSVSINVLPAPEVSASPDTTIFKGQEVLLIGQGATSYHWRPASLVDQANSAVTLAFPREGLNFFILEGQNEMGCRGFDTARVEVLVPEELRIPNAFSPNGDGINDRFYLPNLQYYTLISIRIYNRWGQIVFDSDSPNGWDGRYQGEKAPAGTYTYFIRLLDPVGNPVLKKGNVTLLR